MVCSFAFFSPGGFCFHCRHLMSLGLYVVFFFAFFSVSVCFSSSLVVEFVDVACLGFGFVVVCVVGLG